MIRPTGQEGGFHVFDVDIGHNRYFVVAVGTRARETADGIERLDDVTYEADLEGPLPESRRGRARVRIPSRVFDRDSRLVQLLSTRDADGSGPAISDVVEIRGRLGQVSAGSPTQWSDLPQPARAVRSPAAAEPYRRSTSVSQSWPSPLVRAMGHASMKTKVQTRRGARPAFRTSPAVSFSVTALGSQRGDQGVRIREGDLSHAASLAAIGSMLQGILPQVTQIVGQVAPAVEALAPTIGDLVVWFLRPGRGDGGGATAAPPRRTTAPEGGELSRWLADPNLQRLLHQLVQQVVQANSGGGGAVGRAGGPANGSTAGADTRAAASQAQGLGGRAKALSAQMRRRAKPSAQTLSAGAPYSQAMVAPALLAALPALAPLLQQVLNPQTLQTVIDAPNRATATILNGLKDLANLGIQSHEQDLRHLRELNPGVDDPALDALLQSMSLSLRQAAREEPSYKRAGSVRLSVEEGPVHAIRGIEAAAYRIGEEWGMPLVLRTPRAIKDAKVFVFVKDADTLEIVLKVKGGRGDLADGPLPQPVGIPAEAQQNLSPGRRYLLCAHVVWRNRHGKKRGTSVQQLVRALPRFAFERIERKGNVVPLADPVQDRAFWHKIWAGNFDAEHRKFAFDVKYKVAVVAGGNDVRRSPTRLALEEESSPTTRGKLHARVDVPLHTLLATRDELDPAAEPISPELLEALSSSDFLARLMQTSTRRLEIKGLAGKSGAIWAYLGVKLGTLALLEVENVDELGRVISLRERQLGFPVPTIVHFAGYRTARGAEQEESDRTEGAEAPEVLDGMRKVFDIGATLVPGPTISVRRGEPDAAMSRAARRGGGKVRRRSRVPAHANGVSPRVH